MTDTLPPAGSSSKKKKGGQQNQAARGNKSDIDQLHGVSSPHENRRVAHTTLHAEVPQKSGGAGAGSLPASTDGVPAKSKAELKAERRAIQVH